MDYKLVHKCYEESRMRFYDSKYDHYVNLLDLDPRKDFEDVNVCIHDFDDAKDKHFSSLIQVKNSEIQKITPKESQLFRK